MALAGHPALSRIFRWMERRRFSAFAPARWLPLAKDYAMLRLRGAEIPWSQVRQRARHAARRIGAGYFTAAEASRFKYLEIRNEADPSAAFFAQFLFVLQQLRFAEQHGLIPVVNLDYPYNFYRDAGRPDNVWENFFAPVAGVPSARLEEVDPRTITFLNATQQAALFLGEGDRPPLAYDERAKRWWRSQREMGADLTARYVHVDPDILRAVEDYRAEQLAGRPVVGVHLRGTDKSVRFDGRRHDAPEPFLRIIGPEEYWPVVDRHLDRQPDSLVFVATDQRQYLEAFAARYGERVRCTQSKRSATEQAVFRHDAQGYRRGREVLIDCLLLSRCDLLIKCMSNVGEVALYFNPALPVVDMMYPGSIDEFLRAAPAGIAGRAPVRP